MLITFKYWNLMQICRFFMSKQCIAMQLSSWSTMNWWICSSVSSQMSGAEDKWRQTHSWWTLWTLSASSCEYLEHSIHMGVIAHVNLIQTYDILKSIEKMYQLSWNRHFRLFSSFRDQNLKSELLFPLTDLICKTVKWIENMHQFKAVIQTAPQPHLPDQYQFLGIWDASGRCPSSSTSFSSWGPCTV